MAIGFALDPIAPAGIRAGGGLISRLDNTNELSQSTSRIRTCVIVGSAVNNTSAASTGTNFLGSALGIAFGYSVGYAVERTFNAFMNPWYRETSWDIGFTVQRWILPSKVPALPDLPRAVFSRKLQMEPCRKFQIIIVSKIVKHKNSSVWSFVVLMMLWLISIGFSFSVAVLLLAPLVRWLVTDDLSFSLKSVNWLWLSISIVGVSMVASVCMWIEGMVQKRW
jgi:hypothetical protein